MRDKRPPVNAAAINLVKSSNPQDQVFIVNFNEEYFLDQDYTGTVPKLKDALERIESRGGTALYDAVVASSDHLKKSGALEKKVLLVVTDGEDNASRESLEQALRRLGGERADRLHHRHCWAKSTPSALAAPCARWRKIPAAWRSFPKDLSEVSAITTQIAHDIRNQYTIQYKPTTAERGRISHGESRGPGEGIQEAAGAHAQRILCRPAARRSASSSASSAPGPK